MRTDTLCRTKPYNHDGNWLDAASGPWTSRLQMVTLSGLDANEMQKKRQRITEPVDRMPRSC
jgi:hypothetical protein